MGTDRKVRLVATESQFYGTRQLRPGDEFEADEAGAEDILALGIGRRDETEALQPGQRDEKLALKRLESVETVTQPAKKRVADPLSVKQATKKRPVNPLKPKRKYVKSGKYKRKDMRAED